MDRTLVAAPRWTAPPEVTSKGQDHLGLASVSSDRLLVELLPSINVLTVHPRYHSFYAFLLYEFWQRDLPRSPAAWRDFFRPRDLAYSLACQLCDRPEHRALGGIIGSQRTQAVVRQRLPRYRMDIDYIQAPLGGFGLYYRTVMAELGLLFPGGPGMAAALDVTSDDRGAQLAHNFHKAVSDTQYMTSYFNADSPDLPVEVLTEYGREACLCQLQTTDAPDRPLLRDAFLHAGSGAVSRRDAFRLVLDMARQTDGYPVEDDDFRQLLWFGAHPSGARFTPMPSIALVAQRWRMWQLREYFALGLLALWWHVCAWGVEVSGGSMRAVPLESLWRHLDDAVDIRTIISSGTGPAVTAKSTLETLASVLAQAAQVDAVGPPRLDADIQEHVLAKRLLERPADAATMVTASLALLVLLSVRVPLARARSLPEWSLSRVGEPDRLSVDRFMEEITTRLRGGASVAETLRWIVEVDVIRQHELMAMSKVPRDTFRFVREGDRMRFFPHQNPLSFPSSRFSALATTAHELGFCDVLWARSHQLSDDGLMLLETGELT